MPNFHQDNSIPLHRANGNISSLSQESQLRNHTSSRLINSLLKVNPGITPRFLSQNMAANDPEKKIPSTAAKAITRSPNEALGSLIHLRAQSAFFLTAGIVSMALNRQSLQMNGLLLTVHAVCYQLLKALWSCFPKHQATLNNMITDTKELQTIHE